MHGGKATVNERLTAGLVALALLAFLGVGAWLAPDASGYGTHTQLGLPPCAWAELTGKPCPTCGMTTAVSAVAHGDALGAFRDQPMGAIFALTAAVGFWLALHTAALGSRTWAFAMERALRPATLGGLALGLALAWGYKLIVWPG